MNAPLTIRFKQTLLGLLCILTLTLVGCISKETKVSYGPKGAPVKSKTLKQIKKGQTPKQWVIDTLGEPSEQTTSPEGAELLRYEYTKRTETDFAMFPPPIAFDTDKERQTTYVFEIKDGVIAKYWKEK
jgi:outer membrane protein assembly factor BamE (lipoprotein component of BamABCDE complex)